MFTVRLWKERLLISPGVMRSRSSTQQTLTEQLLSAKPRAGPGDAETLVRCGPCPREAAGLWGRLTSQQTTPRGVSTVPAVSTGHWEARGGEGPGSTVERRIRPFASVFF